MLKVGINGFGRIGRRITRLAFEQERAIQIVHINEPTDIDTAAHLLKYDSVHRTFGHDIQHAVNQLTINDSKIHFTHFTNPHEIPWHETDVDVVIECSGKFKDRVQLEQHLKPGVKRVILSVPPTDDSIKTVVLGVNEFVLTQEDQIISNASCTTNNVAPIIKIIDDLCGIEQAFVSTVHSYTSDQTLHDRPHRDLRRGRAAGSSIIPTTTGAAKALTKIFPHLSNVIGGCGIRVPVANGSLSDITINLKRTVPVSAIHAAIQEYESKQEYQIINYSTAALVSVDILGSPYSCIYDANMTTLVDKMLKIITWYDNETGYSSRILDLLTI
ncbi:MAG: type I glyceraldehyde-3-phosphate dehydrogenase [Flavobacteriaceae bacterium]|nr:type I glyceraldehyde-3-phosphate dehydrogenase [Flavobacteriaceae bacterium]